VLKHMKTIRKEVQSRETYNSVQKKKFTSRSRKVHHRTAGLSRTSALQVGAQHSTRLAVADPFSCRGFRSRHRKSTGIGPTNKASAQPGFHS